jgi:transposase
VAAAQLEKAGRAWDGALAVIDETRKKQAQTPGLAEPAKKALATLDREWDGLAAHRSYPLVSLDNYPDVAVMSMFAGGGGSAAGQGGALAA